MHDEGRQREERRGRERADMTTKARGVTGPDISIDGVITSSVYNV